MSFWAWPWRSGQQQQQQQVGLHVGEPCGEIPQLHAVRLQRHVRRERISSPPRGAKQWDAEGHLCKPSLPGAAFSQGWFIDAYSKNDLLCAPALKLQKGDLALRDRGYLLANELQRHLDAGADCIYRHKTGTLHLDPDTLQPIDLLAELRKNGCLDLRVLLNNKAQTPVRLLSAPVSQETASLRRVKAKKEMRGQAPSAAVLALMDWTVFIITTIAAPEADFKTILAIYGLRWRVEVLFKSWKSHLNFDLIHRVSKTQLRILLTARFLIITTLTNWLHPKCHDLISKVYGKQLSLLKFLHYLTMKPRTTPSTSSLPQPRKLTDPARLADAQKILLLWQ
jgi:hypothetical protein